MAAAPSAGLTQWSRFDVPRMWSLLRNVSTVEAFRQAGAWQSTYEAAQSLARRLQWYRDGLASKWSPDSSEAAALYLGRLDELIGSAQQLADVSVANRQALVTLANAVDEARPKLQRVYEESQALRQIEAQPRAVALVTSRQQQLHKQATEIMESLGAAAMDSWRHYATADDYQPPFGTDPGHADIVPEQEDNNLMAGSNGSPSRSDGRDYGAVHDDKARFAVEAESDVAASRVAGYKFPTPTLSSGSLESNADGPPSHRLPVVDAADRNAIADPFVQGLGFVTQEYVEKLNNSPSLLHAAENSFVAVAERSRLPVGGVIDGAARASSDVSYDESAPRSTNRIGGVIGNESTGLGAMGLGSPVGGGQKSQTRRRLFDDVEDWSVTKGVTPVIAPASGDTEFDPGPGVIGLDR
jgi:hypothetical protein